MISKKDFNKVWKDSTREGILNQYYYDYIDLIKAYSIIKEAREEIRILETNYDIADYQAQKLFQILDKVEEKK